MENDNHWVFECNIEIKSEPDEHADELNETDTFCETGTEPSTSDEVHHDLSTLPYYSYNNKSEGEELEIPPKQDYDESDKFCLESDQVALNSNIDYQKLLEGIYILETQRAQAIADLDELYELQEQALLDPNAFLEKLRNHNVNFSSPSKIDELPVTDWSKYELNFNASRIRMQQTKLAAKISDFIKSVGEKRTDEDFPIGQEVRKNRYKLWTAEEQKRLEELLIQFPPENVESRRYEKIANCLENRTAGQVAGRVKKYFQALKKHGISFRDGIPPTDYVKKPCSCIIGPNPSTYLVSHQPPIYKPDGSKEKSNLIFEERRKLIRHNFILKHWTDKEQKKLDDLLIQFPPEENENSRWEKISECLKNRTPRQVASRVRYLKRLMQDGRFVPGKIPGIQFNEMSSADFPRYSHGGNIMQYWTPEEHRRLEELLMLFPPEKHAYRRWKKIAKCLGNRTPDQVGSRAKSYFVMLKRYGMPVPGKVPPKSIPKRKYGRKRSCQIVSDSSFISDYSHYTSSPTVENSMESEMDGSGENDPDIEVIGEAWREKPNSNGLAPIVCKSENDFNQEVELNGEVWKQKQSSSGLTHFVDKGEKDINKEVELMENPWKEKQNSSGLAHIGYKCSRCKVEPITGVRWHCTVCNIQSVDFCSDCCTSEYKELDEHRFDHALAAIREVTH